VRAGTGWNNSWHVVQMLTWRMPRPVPRSGP
jgi:hypothetical protein